MSRSPRLSVVPRSGILTLILLFILSACSSSGSSGTGSSSSASTSAEPSGSAAESSAATPAPEKATVTVGLSQPIFSFTPLYVGDAKGFWKDENLDVQITVFNAGAETQQAILGDAITLGAGGYTEPINLTSQGAPTVIFGTIQGALPYRLMTQPDITDISQLDGKTLAVSKIGSLSDQITRIALNKMGFDPNKVKYQQAGGSPSRLAALQSKAVDGTLLDSPSYQLAQKAGMTTLLNVADELKGYPYEVLYAKKATIEANQDVFLRFMRGFDKAAAYATDPANESEVLDIVAAATGQKATDLKLAYDETIKDFPADGAIDKDGLQAALEGTQKFADVKGADKITVDDLYYDDLVKAAAGS